jgi:hypothetical protein
MSKYQAQKKLKPKVEDIARDLLDEEKLANLLDFLELLKANKLTPRWYATNSWTVKHKNKTVCVIKMNWIPQPSDKENYWGIYHSHFTREKWFVDYDRYLTDHRLKGFIWDNINPPYACSQKGGTVICKGRPDMIILGKPFKSVCSCYSLVAKNPEGKTLEQAKELVLFIKNYIVDLATTDLAYEVVL